MKKKYNILLAIALIISIFSMTAITSSAATSGGFEYTIANGEATITKYTGTSVTVTIPSVLGVLLQK